MKSTVGKTIVLISHSETLCIVYSSLACPIRSGVMAKIAGKFPVNSIYSEFPSLPPKLASGVTSLSGFTGNMCGMAWPSVGNARFEFILTLPTASGVAVLGAAVSVSAWATWVVSVLSGKAGHSSLSVRTLGDNSWTYGWKTTWGMAWQSIG